MSSVINTNALSISTQNNLTKSQGALNSAIERLSSGMRINGAKDDAAGQAIANRFTSSIKGLNQAQRNANDGISLAQTTESALGEINTNLQRVRELTVQSLNGTNSTEDKTSLQAEIDQRLAEINRVSTQTDFNGTKVLASNATVTIQVGAKDGETIGISLKQVDTTAMSMASFSVTGTATNNLATVDAALKFVDVQRGALGAAQNRLDSVVSNIGTTVSNLSASRSRIEDADYATEVSNMSRAQILQQAGTSVLAQANQTTQGVMSLLR